jgi:5-formyltetrahydrofolate cyclo-ligase
MILFSLYNQFGMSTKKTFRQQMKAKLANIPKEVIEQESLVIFKKITCHPQYQTASKISCFLNMEGEVRTAEIVKHLFLNGLSIFKHR